jgi:hypothetical protein
LNSEVLTLLLEAKSIVGDLPSLLLEIETKITAYPSEAPGFNPVFSGVRVSQSLVLCVLVSFHVHISIWFFN